ncbi:hypothetical protein AHOG_14870 [Actinoalloteichus hoggarensis]|uniref:Uncharacterized protein n=2 Tax=Actinoalloteichus hoggarensis TaxID=1470176 RepID=A0A221W459_9PSEU|nr:hypothetical protein AHOG_14870 [Actinoalloteichus hoggarensis]
MRFVVLVRADEDDLARLPASAHGPGRRVREDTATRLVAMAERFRAGAGFAVANRTAPAARCHGCLADHGIEKAVRPPQVHQTLERINEIMRVTISRRMQEAP